MTRPAQPRTDSRPARFGLRLRTIQRRVEPLRQLAGRLRPVLRVFRQRVEHQLFDFRRRPPAEAEFRECGCEFGRVGQQNVHRGRPVERNPTGDEFVHHDADGIQVAAVVHLLPANLLRADVARRANREIDIGVCDLPRPRLAFDELRQAEIHDFDALTRRVRVRDHQVRRLEVAVNDAFVVSRLEHLAQLPDDAADARCAHPPVLGEKCFEVNPAHVLHHDARPKWVVEAGVVEGHGPGVLEPGHEQRFALEAVAELWVGRDLLVHHLDDDFAPEIELPGKVDLAHPAFAQQATRLIATQKNAADH